jgi:hypothetical protein
MFFKKDKDIPAEVAAVDLGKWYSGLSDQDKVKLGRYLKDADTSSVASFFKSVMNKMIEDENESIAVTAGSYAMSLNMDDISRYDINEKLILAYYGMKKYDECLEACKFGLSMIPSVKPILFERSGGKIPGDVYCRNYTLNVLVGIFFDYDAGDAALDEFLKLGLISEEDLEYRKQSNKIFRLQRTFDGIYTIKIKDGQ